MKNLKKFIAALLVLSMLLAVSVSALAKAKIEEDAGAVFTGTAWGYKQAKLGTRSKIAICKDSLVQVSKVSKDGKWAKVLVDPDNDTLLWFQTKYLAHYSEVDEEDMKPIRFAAGGTDHSDEDDEAQEIKYKTSYKKVQVKKGKRTNVRKTASLKGKTLGVVRSGQKIKYLGVRKMDLRGVFFYKVKYNGKTAWISSEYTKLVKK